nr:Ycf46 [Erythrocladia irregularis]
MNFIKELEFLLKSRHSIICITTQEENRFEYVFKEFVESHYPSNYLLYWDFITGFQGNPNYYSKAARNPLQSLELIETVIFDNYSFFVLKDFNVFLSDNSIVRKIRNLSKYLSQNNKNVIILTTEKNIPLSLVEVVTTLRFPLPTILELRDEIFHLSQLFDIKIDSNFLNQLTQLCQGLTLERTRKVIFRVFASPEDLGIRALNIILNEKKRIISQTNILEFCSQEVTIDDIGGLTNLKNWLRLRVNSFSDQAMLYGLPSPKGLLLVGIQGTGKSLTAKVVASEWKMPLLRLDVGKLFGGVVGESESQVRQMIFIAESLSPCVLWIDEIDKAFRGFQSTSDSGTTSRVFGTFITWLSEKTSPVFVVATANDIYSLPPELLRKGRFDEIFFLGLPSVEERKSIFSVHLSKLRPRTWSGYDIAKISSLAVNFSGAEIQQCIVEAMYKAFSEQREFNTQDICDSISDIVPLAHTYSEAVANIQNWASAGKIRFASTF